MISELLFNKLNRRTLGDIILAWPPIALLELLLFNGIETPKNPLIETSDNVQEEQVKQETKHTVVKNDTLEKIGKVYSVEWKRIFYKNLNVDHQDQLEVGMELIIPTADEKLIERVLHPQLVNTATTTQNTTTRAVYTPSASPDLSWWDFHSCTWHVASKRPVGFWNNGSLWYAQAQRDGWSTGLTPAVGAIGVAKSGNHVIYTEAVDGDRIYLSERNYDNKGSYRERWASASDFRYIY